MNIDFSAGAVTIPPSTQRDRKSEDGGGHEDRGDPEASSPEHGP